MGPPPALRGVHEKVAEDKPENSPHNQNANLGNSFCINSRRITLVLCLLGNCGVGTTRGAKSFRSIERISSSNSCHGTFDQESNPLEESELLMLEGEESRSVQSLSRCWNGVFVNATRPCMAKVLHVVHCNCWIRWSTHDGHVQDPRDSKRTSTPCIVLFVQVNLSYYNQLTFRFVFSLLD